MALFESGLGPDFGRLRRRVIADVAVRHPEDTLDVVVLAPGWDMKAVGDQVVHCPQAGRTDVADPGDLDWCRPPGEDQQPVVEGVAREVEEDIDPVAADTRGKRLVVEPGNVVPLVGRSRDSIGQRVAALPRAVADDRERPPIDVLSARTRK